MREEGELREGTQEVVSTSVNEEMEVTKSPGSMSERHASTTTQQTRHPCCSESSRVSALERLGKARVLTVLVSRSGHLCSTTCISMARPRYSDDYYTP